MNKSVLTRLCITLSRRSGDSLFSCENLYNPCNLFVKRRWTASITAYFQRIWKSYHDKQQIRYFLTCNSPTNDSCIKSTQPNQPMDEYTTHVHIWFIVLIPCSCISVLLVCGVYSWIILHGGCPAYWIFAS